MTETANVTVSSIGSPRVSKMLELSTAHISPETNRLLEAGNLPYLAVHEKKDCGFLILIPGKEEDITGTPVELLGILEYGSSLDCDWIMLDRDYDLVDGLPTFEW